MTTLLRLHAARRLHRPSLRKHRHERSPLAKNMLMAPHTGALENALQRLQCLAQRIKSSELLEIC